MMPTSVHDFTGFRKVCATLIWPDYPLLGRGCAIEAREGRPFA
jgi:hypothetical protein